MTCTQEELLQVLSKLMQERKKVKALEQRLEGASDSKLIASSTAQTDALQKEVELLQKIIREQTVKLEALPERDSSAELQALKMQHSLEKEALLKEAAKQHSHIQTLREELTLKERIPASPDKNNHELQALKERIFSLEEQLEQERKTAHTLSQGSTIPDFSFELETTERELKISREKIKQLEEMLVIARKEAPEALEAELENFRLQARELYAKEKELERKLSLATHERQQLKVTLDAREKELLKLIQENEFLKKASENAHNSAAEFAVAFAEKNALQNRVDELYQDLKALRDSEKSLQELLQAKKALSEKLENENERLKASNKHLESETSAQKNDISLLEEHLTRRMKDCTQLSNELEESKSESLTKARKIERLELELSESNSKSQSDIDSFKAALSASEEELAELAVVSEEQEEELYQLRKIGERYALLEELFEQYEKVLTKRTPEPKKTTLKATTKQKSADLFTSPPAQSRRYDLFQ